MFKHGEPGWRIEYRCKYPKAPSWAELRDPEWNWCVADHRAVRIEKVVTRTPLPIEHYRRGMEVLYGIDSNVWLVLGSTPNKDCIGAVCGMNPQTQRTFQKQDITHWRWPNEAKWKPAYTEATEEREVERLEVEG